MGDVEDAHVGVGDQALQQLEHLGTDRHVQARDRLVGDDQLRIRSERAGDHHPLALAAGELEAVTAAVAAGRGEGDPLQQLVDRGLELGPTHRAIVLQRPGQDVLKSLVGVQRGVRVLEHHLHEAAIGPQLPAAEAAHVDLPVPGMEADATGGGSINARDQAREGGFARAGLPHQGGHHAAAQLEADVVDREGLGLSEALAGVEDLGHRVDLEEDLGREGPLRLLRGFLEGGAGEADGPCRQARGLGLLPLQAGHMAGGAGRAPGALGVEAKGGDGLVLAQGRHLQQLGGVGGAQVYALGAARGEGAADERLGQVRGPPRHVGDPHGLLTGVAVGAEQALGVGVEGLAQQVVGVVLLDDPAGVHHQDAVRQVHDGANVVADEQHREALLLLQLAHPFEDRALHDHVQAGGRLVQQNELRVVDQGEREVHALLHAAGELMGVGADEAVVNQDQVEHLLDPLSDLGAASRGVQLDGVAELVLDAHHWVQRIHRGLEDGGEVAPSVRTKLRLAHLGDVHAVEADAPAGDPAGPLGQAQDRGAEGGLPGAGFADQAHELAGLDGEGDSLDGVQRRVEPWLVAHREVLDLEEGSVLLGPIARNGALVGVDCVLAGRCLVSDHLRRPLAGAGSRSGRSRS